MERKEYWIEPGHLSYQLLPKEQREEAIVRWEKILRAFILSQADTVRLTRQTYKQLPNIFATHGGVDTDPRHVEVRKRLEQDFVREVVNNRRYPEFQQFKHSRFEHHFYRLSATVKDAINSETFLTYPLFGALYGYEDPTFYKEERYVGTVVSHEGYLQLSLNQPEQDNLVKDGIPREAFVRIESQ